MVKNYADFSEELKVKRIIEHIEYSVNESLDIKSLVKSTLDKINSFKVKNQKKVLSYLLMGLISVYGLKQASATLLNSGSLNSEQKVMVGEVIEKEAEKQNLEENPFKAGNSFILSQNGWDSIRDEESLRLTAYSIGDGMITVGWGHAEKTSNSNYSVGQTITEEEAQKLLKEDLTDAADVVRGIFTEWEEQDIDVPITQDMFDALVSITFNAGRGAIRRADFIQELKKGNYEKVGEMIKTFRTSDKFPGLKKRRQNESDTFMSYKDTDLVL